MERNSNVDDDDCPQKIDTNPFTGYESVVGSVNLAEDDLEGDDIPPKGVDLERPLDATDDKEISETVNNINLEAKTTNILTAHVSIK